MPIAAFRSSGDLNADRRYVYALDLLAEGDASAAADLLVQTLDLTPGWPAGWFQLGLAQEAAGDRASAIAAFARAQALDPDDGLGAGLHLARLGDMPTPDAPPAAYVRDLFDAYAPRFDHALVDGLDYRAPHLIAAALASVREAHSFARALDLGCGTGLMGAALRPRVGTLDGVDLSAGMIEIARAKGLYDRLVVADLIVGMTGMTDATYDLIVAADVFCYLGELSGVIDEAARVLVSGGHLAFSVEAYTEADTSGHGIGPGFVLADSLRFRHAPHAIESQLRAAGLILRQMEPAVLRTDRGRDIAGLVVVAVKPDDCAI